MSEQNSRPNEIPLESWKEIAGYLKRDVRTVVRWEKEEKLPVRRHHHKSRSSVYAYPSELEAWKAAREPALDKAVSGPIWRRPVPAFGLTLAMLLALVTFASGPLLTPSNALAQGSDAMTVRRVWAGPGVGIAGGPSPDAQYLSYVDWSTGDLAIRELGTGKNRRLTNKGSWSESSEMADYSVISPDGKWVAYNWFNKDNFFDLRIVGIDGIQPRVLYANEELGYMAPAAWSPDGKSILALATRNDRTNQIVSVSVADGSMRVIKTLSWRYPQKLSLSPDGSTIAYDYPPRTDSPTRDIYLLASDGSRETTLVKHSADDLFPVWAPDGKRILFASDRSGSMGLWAIPVVDGKPMGSPEVVKADIGRIFPMNFTSDGSFYFGLGTRMSDIYTAELDLATGKLLSPPTRAVESYVDKNGSPAWSPDGQYMAYLSQRGPVPQALGSNVISILTLKTGEERELSLGSIHTGTNRGLRWSPDGSSILLQGKDTKGRQGVYRITTQTGEVTPVLQGEPEIYFYLPVWSPDGEVIFYLRLDRLKKLDRIMSRDLKSGRVKELARGGVGNPVLSPDGRQLAYVSSNRTTRLRSLMVMPSGGGEARELLTVKNPVGISLFTWTQDGQQVLFRRKPDTNREDLKDELWRISVEGGEPQKLELEMDWLRHLRIHPDGKRVVFKAGRPEAEVWVMENFLPKAEVQAARLEE